MDELDRALINCLQDGLPVCRRPYDAVAAQLGIPVGELLGRIEGLLDKNILSRFGPMFNAEKLGGALTLCAMQAPLHRYDEVAEQVNALPEVAHNYAREHDLNMWFVLATESPEQIPEVIAGIERQTGCRVYNMPKLDEFYIGLKLAV
ncbi:MAG: AsnC family transcriptional regulator [Gammaproteobacteria bacterium]